MGVKLGLSYERKNIENRALRGIFGLRDRSDRRMEKAS
jgi:hypothetical protein